MLETEMMIDEAEINLYLEIDYAAEAKDVYQSRALAIVHRSDIKADCR